MVLEILEFDQIDFQLHIFWIYNYYNMSKLMMVVLAKTIS